MLFHKREKKNCEAASSNNSPSQPSRELPVPTDAKDILSMYCEMMQAMDMLMKENNISFEGDGMLLGGTEASGNSNVHFSYTQDIPVTTFFSNAGFNVPIDQSLEHEGWKIGGYEDDYVYLDSTKTTGYREWIQYDKLKELGCSDRSIEQSWASSIHSLIEELWPNAEITRCNTCIDEKGAFSYDVRIKTH